MKRVVTFGEVMLRLATPGFDRFTQAKQYHASFGGGEANVAVSLSNFGINACFITRLPENDIGRACKMELKKYGIDTRHIAIGGERLGIYFLETGAVARASKVLYDRAGSAFATVEKGMFDWELILRDADVFHWTGITPAVSEGAANACMEAIQVANKMGVMVTCDLNYRKKLWQYGKKAGEIMPEMVAGCDVVMGNEEDAEMTLGIKPDGVDIHGGQIDPEAYRSVSEQIMKSFPRAGMVITTLRGSISASHNNWSGVLFDGRDMYMSPVYQITHIVDRVGGGDSFMAGLIFGILNYAGDHQRIIDFAAAASCLKHTIYGDFNMVSVDEVEKLMQGDASGRVSR